MNRRDADAVVVGAGPTGSAAAFFLAAHGHRVLLLDKRRFPRDKSCGDGVTQPGLEVMREMGVLEQLAGAQRYDGLRVRVRGRGTRDIRADEFRDEARRPDRGMVVPRLRLDALLCRAAAERGAELCEEHEASELLGEDGRVYGVRTVHRGRERVLRAPFVVCADGATSGLARQAGLVSAPREAMGYAIRGYYGGLRHVPDMLEFHLPVTDAEDEFLLPSYGWVFPTAEGEANIGIGLSFRAHGANVRRLFERFMAHLGAEERFAAAQQLGPWRGAPLRSDFVADRCQAPGVLVAGDAAGLVSPFTGEGISYGLESGKLAAEAVHRALAHGEEDSRFVATLRRRYGGYFEAGRETTQSYALAFRVLESTFDDDRPLFALWRRAALLPEGVGALRSSDVLDDIGDLVEPLVMTLRADLAAVDEALARTVQREWPFLSRFGASVDRDLAVPPRPATLLLLCGYLGRPDPQLMIELAVAVELGYFSALTHAGVDVEAGGADHLGNVFAVMTGNFQLAKALELSTRAGPDALGRMAGALAALCEGRVHQLLATAAPDIEVDAYVEAVARSSGRMFEAICDLGALLAGLGAEEAGALRTYGRALGTSYQLGEEIVSVAGGPAVGASATAELAAGRLVLPAVHALTDEALRPSVLEALRGPRERVDEALGSIATGETMHRAFEPVKRYARAAREAAAELPGGPAREALHELTRFPVRRAGRYLPERGPTLTRSATNGGGRTDAAWSLPERLGVGGDVRRLRELLERWRDESDREVQEIVTYQLEGSAKYYRPCTIFACHRAAGDGPPAEPTVHAAAALELFHNYTLIVDDIVDRDATRRGKPAVHRRFGRVRGLAGGAYLAFGSVRLVADDARTCHVFAELGRRLVVAECRQWRLRRQVNGIDEWRRIAGEDTGVMFEMCARLGAPDGSLDRFGYLLGTLYHGCDDVADVRGAAALGGGSEKDITDRILTLPASLALRDPSTAELFVEGGSDADDELAARYAAVLDDAEAILDGLARDAEREAVAAARRPQPLVDLVAYTRELSRA